MGKVFFMNSKFFLLPLLFFGAQIPAQAISFDMNNNWHAPVGFLCMATAGLSLNNAVSAYHEQNNYGKKVEGSTYNADKYRNKMNWAQKKCILWGLATISLAGF